MKENVLALSIQTHKTSSFLIGKVTKKFQEKSFGKFSGSKQQKD